MKCFAIGKAWSCGTLEQVASREVRRSVAVRARFTRRRHKHFGGRVSIDDEIQACEAELRQAQLTGDVVVLDRLLDDSLVFTNIDGTLASKSDDLSAHRSGRLRITRMEPSDLRLLHLGATSVVSVRMNAEAIINGAPVTATLRYTRIWHRRTEGWRLVAGHMSTVAA
jgi:ketosteroid isomerase-like protein